MDTTRAKIWLLGPEVSGKSTIVKTIKTNTAVFDKSYNQTQSPQLSLYHYKKNVELYILDTAGAEIYSDIQQDHFDKQDATAVIITIDLTNIESLKSIKRYIKVVRSLQKAQDSRTVKPAPLALVGTKSDLSVRRVITSTQGNSLVDKLKVNMKNENIKWFETTTKNPNSVKQVFDWVGEIVQEDLHVKSAGGAKKYRMMDDPIEA